MAQGPSLQGQIVINTKSVDRAINSIKKLQVNVGKAFGGGSRQAERFAKALSRQGQTYQKVANDSRKYSSTIAKAANTVANYEASVRKSNIADSKKASLVKAATAQLKGFESAVKGGATSGKALNNVTTQLNVSLGQLRRDLSSATAAEREKTKAAQQHEKAQIKTDKAVSAASQQYERARASIRASSLAEAEKVELLSKLDSSHRRLNNTLTKTGTSVRSASSAQNQYSETLNKVNIATKRTAGGFGSASGATNSYADEMRNLSTSVQFALGPLSGIAARITALTTLFNRNAASVAALIASMTGFTVLLTKSMQAGQEAEKQMFRINAQLEQMGDNAQVTGSEINNMAHEIAAGTLLSAKEVRDASGSLIEFSGIAREQFGSVIKTAQGMSAVFGGNLRSNIRRLGRAIEDPISGFSRLEQTGVILNESTKEQIETLVAQGRAYEATNILLEETASLQKAAGEEAAGLAGAYDTLSGNLDLLFEQLSVGSGATETFATSIQGVAQAVADFAASDKARALGESFRYVGEVAGRAFKFAIENINVLAGVLAVVAGSVIPKVVAMVLTLAASMAKNLFGAVMTTIGVMQNLSTNTKKATVSFAAFNSTLRANPLIAIVSGVVALTGAIWGYNQAMEAVRSAGEGFNQTMLDQIEAEIVARDDLGKHQADNFRDRMDNLAEETRKIEEQFDRRIGLANDLEKASEDAFALDGTTKRFEVVNGEAVDLLDTVEGIGKLMKKDLTPEQKQMLEDYRSAKISANEVRASMERVTTETKNLKEQVRTVEAELSKLGDGDKLTAITESLDKMGKKLLPDETKTAELRKQLQIVQANASALKMLGLENQDVNEAYEKSLRLSEAIKDELKQLGDIGFSDEFHDMADALVEARSEAALLASQVGKTDEERAVLQLDHDMRQLAVSAKEAFKAMKPSEVAGFGNMLPGVDEASGINEVVEAYVKFMRAQEEAMQAAEKQQENLDMIAELRGEYGLTTDATQEFADKQQLLAEQFEKTKDPELLHMMEQYALAFNEVSESADNAADRFKNFSDTVVESVMLSTQGFTDMSLKIPEILETMGEAFENADFLDFDKEVLKMSEGMRAGIAVAGSAMEQTMNLMESAGKEGTNAYKAMAIAQATMAAGMATMNAWAAAAQMAVMTGGGLPVFLGVGGTMTGLIAATLGAQIAQITGANFATGGRVQGPGTATSDSIPANLSDGEYVINARAAKKIGMNNLERMNRGGMPSFATGGNVGMMPIGMPVASGGGSEGKIDVTVIDNSDGDKKFTAEETVGPDGMKKLKVTIDSVVKDSINRGNYDGNMAAAYGLRRGKKT